MGKEISRGVAACWIGLTLSLVFLYGTLAVARQNFMSMSPAERARYQEEKRQSSLPDCGGKLYFTGLPGALKIVSLPMGVPLQPCKGKR